MINYNAETLGDLIKLHLDESGDTVEDFSKNTGISIQFVKQMIDDKRSPSTKLSNTSVIDRISAYTGDSFDDVHKAALATERKLSDENELKREEKAVEYAKFNREQEKKEKFRAKVQANLDEQNNEYVASLSIKTGYEITVLKEKEPIKIYGEYEVVEIGGAGFIEHDDCLYGVSCIVKIKPFEFVIDADGNVKKNHNVSNGKIEPNFFRSRFNHINT